MAAKKQFTATFSKKKETKGTHVFQEDGEANTHKIGGLYIKKAASNELGNPDKIRVTVVVS